MKLTSCMVAVLTLGLLNVPLWAKDKKNHEFQEHAPDKQESRDIATVITHNERDVIRGYVLDREAKHGKGKKLPPGLEKKLARGGKLPPGWERKVAPGTVIEEELWKESHPLPREVMMKLPPPPPGTILRAIEGKVIRVMEKTRQILDVFDPMA